MKNNGVILIIIIIVFLFREIEISPEVVISPKEQSCLAFVEQQLMNTIGGIRTTYHSQSWKEQYASGNEVLSESQGSMMLYYSRLDDRGKFDLVYSYLNNYLQGNDVIYYRTNYPLNAIVDDFRIIKGLYEASKTFGDTFYSKEAIKLSNRLYTTNVKSKKLYDFYDERYSMTNDFITLCYVDFETLKIMGRWDWRWQAVYTYMLKIVKNGYLSDEFPLYASRYDYGKAAFETQEMHIAEALLTLLHLAEVGELPDCSLEWLREQVINGTLYGAYDSQGNALNRIESTAAYAIAAQIGAVLDDEVLYIASISKMEQWFINDQVHPMYGAFGDPVTHTAYSFDNVMALLAYTH